MMREISSDQIECGTCLYKLHLRMRLTIKSYDFICNMWYDNPSCLALNDIIVYSVLEKVITSTDKNLYLIYYLVNRQMRVDVMFGYGSCFIY